MLWIHSILLFMLFMGQAGNQVSPQANPATQVDKIFETWNRTDSPGCALSVMKDGNIIYKHGYGMADLDHDVSSPDRP